MGAAGSLLPSQAGDRWLIGSVNFELIQDQPHSSGHREDAKISLATMPRDKLIKPLKENLGAGGNDGPLIWSQSA